MATPKLDQLLFAQGGLCFFCRAPIPRSKATIEHLVATSNGGRNDVENCVACCAAINRLLGSMSLKEKVQVVLNQKGEFRCPDSVAPAKKKTATRKPARASSQSSRFSEALAFLQNNSKARPASVKTLRSSLHNKLKKETTEEELTALVSELRDAGYIKIAGDKVEYTLPKDDA